MFSSVGHKAKTPYAYSCPYQTPAFLNVEITCGIAYVYIFLLYTAFRVTSQLGQVIVMDKCQSTHFKDDLKAAWEVVFQIIKGFNVITL